MKVNSISSVGFGAGVNIIGSENKHRQYLYNDIEAIRKEFKIPVLFHTQKVELPSVSKAVIAKLNELGIKFKNI